MLYYGDKPIGAVVKIELPINDTFLLFSESQSRAIVSVSPSNLSHVEDKLKSSNQYYKVIGEVGGNFLKINKIVDCEVNAMRKTYFSSLERFIKK